MLDTLYGGSGDRGAFWLRYWVLLTLSAIIAAAGLSADSGAVIIGAMLIAPLMTPMLGFVAATCAGLRWHGLVAAFVIAASTAWVVVVSWALVAALPNVELSAEVLRRTDPDVRDLIVALAAGIAGSWATLRPDVSPTLPGVAVAVALVPPLAAAGVVLNAHEGALAEGALLLYAANLLAIVGSSFVVFVIGGFPPWRSQRGVLRVPMVIAGCIVTAIAVLSWPLWQRAASVADANRQDRLVDDVVHAWLVDTPSLEVVDVSIFGSNVTVDVVGPDVPPTADALADALVDTLGNSVSVQVRWSERLDGSDLHDEPDLLSVVRGGVEQWASDRGPDLFIDRVTVDETVVRVRVSSTSAPPDGDTLLPYLPAGSDWVVSIAWSQLVNVVPVDPNDNVVDLLIREAAVRWAEPLRLTVIEVHADTDTTVPRIEVVVAGETVPGDAAALRMALTELFRGRGQGAPALVVSYVPRLTVPLSTTTSTSTTTTTTVALASDTDSPTDTETTTGS